MEFISLLQVIMKEDVKYKVSASDAIYALVSLPLECKHIDYHNCGHTDCLRLITGSTKKGRLLVQMLSRSLRTILPAAHWLKARLFTIGSFGHVVVMVLSSLENPLLLMRL